MPVIQFRSPVNKPLLRKGTPKPVPPDPRAYDTFRVTQQYADIDAYFGNKLHMATDIGNFTCGDPLVAMAGGTAWPLKDNASALGAPSDALGVKVDHGNGITTEIWHMNRVDITGGQKVSAGDQIGIVGSTGLGTVCHAHVEAKRDGVRFDPEPLMFGGFVVAGEDPVLPDFTPFATGLVPGGNNLRAEPNVTSDNFYISSPRTFDVLGFVPSGGPYVIGGVTGKEWVCIKGEKVWYIARPLITITPTSEGSELGGGGFTADDMAKAKAEGEKIGRIDMHTKHVAQQEKNLAETKAIR